MLRRAPGWANPSFNGGAPTLDSGYKNWDLCAHGNRVESHPPIFSLPKWGPAAITGASGCGSCSGATTYNGDPKTAGLGLQLAPPNDLFGDPGQLPPSPTDHPFVLADTGEVVYTETDFVIKGTGFDFVFTRTYRSALDFEGWLGYGWTHSAECVLLEDSNGDITAFLGDGRPSDLYVEDSGSYTSPDGHYDLLESGTRPGGHAYAGETYFTKTEKSGVIWEFDLGLDVTNAVYVCTSIKDPWSNDFTFVYADQAPTTGYEGIRLTTLTCPDGQVATFSYDSGPARYLEKVKVSNTSTHVDYGDLEIDYTRHDTFTDVLIKAEKHKTRLTDGGSTVRPYTSYDYYASGIEVKNLKYVRDCSTTTNNVFFFEYETAGTDRCKKVTDADGDVHEYAHDQDNGANDYAKYTDPSSQRRDFVYADLAGGDRIIKQVREYLEDEDGTDITTPADMDILRECDCGRITRLTYTDGSKEEWDYDANGNIDEYRRIGTGATGTIRKVWDWDTFASHCKLKTTSGWLRDEAVPGTKVTYTWDGTNGTLDKVAWPAVTSGQPSSQTIEWDYTLSGTDGTLSTIEDPEGHTTDYDWVGRELTITAGTDVTAEERILTVTKYDLMGNVEHQYGPYGGASDKWDYTVTMDGRVLKIEGAEGEVTEHDYDLRGRRDDTTHTLSTGVTVVTDYTVSNGGRVTSVVADSEGTGKLEATTTYGYDEADASRYAQTTDPDGFGPKSKWGYGSHNLPWKKYQVDTGDDPDTETLVATLERDTMGRVTATVTMGGDRVEYLYDGYGRRIKTTTTLKDEIDPVHLIERRVELTLKDWGAVDTSETKVDTTIVATKTTVTWTETNYFYDEAIRQYKMVRDDVVGSETDITTEVVLDKNGRAATRKDARAKSWLTEWTSAGDVKKTTDPVGNITETSYDDANRKVTRTEKDWDTSGTPSLGGTYVSETHYDKSGRVSSSKNKGSGAVYRTTTYTYDLAGRTTKVTLPGSRETAYVYDKLGRQLTETVDIDVTPTTAVTNTTWSLGGRRSEVEDANDKDTKWTYDDFGRELTVKYPTSTGGATWNTYTKTYDSSGRLSTVTDPEGGVLTYGYDDGGRRVTVDITKTGTDLVGPDRLLFTFDDMDRVLTGKTQTGSEGSGWTDVTSVTRTYDGFGRLDTETQNAGTVLDYACDDSGNITEILYPTSGDAGPITGVQYLYDDNGRMDSVKRKLSTVVEDITTEVWVESVTLEYEGGREIERVQGVYDLKRTQTWTAYREPEELKYVDTSSSNALRTGLFNEWSADEGYLVVRERLHDDDGDKWGEVYRYDEMGRMTKYWTDVKTPRSHVSTDPTVDYLDKIEHTIGKVYGRTQVKVTPEGGSPATTAYTVNDGYQITDLGGTGWTWDDNGELTDSGAWDYTWTALGQLATADHATHNDRAHTYDAFGRRVKTVGGSTTYEYLYHGWHMVGEHDGTDWLWMEIPAAWGEGMFEHISLDTNDIDGDTDTTEYRTYAPHTDFQKTVWGVSEKDGDLIERYEQDDPYGVTHTLDAGSSSIGDYATEVYHRKRLHGGVVDAVVEIYDFRNRWMRPEEGGWMSRDPLGPVDSWNLMQALAQQPTSMSDPDGLYISGRPTLHQRCAEGCTPAENPCKGAWERFRKRSQPQQAPIGTRASGLMEKLNRRLDNATFIAGACDPSGNTMRRVTCAQSATDSRTRGSAGSDTITICFGKHKYRTTHIVETPRGLLARYSYSLGGCVQCCPGKSCEEMISHEIAHIACFMQNGRGSNCDGDRGPGAEDGLTACGALISHCLQGNGGCALAESCLKSYANN